MRSGVTSALVTMRFCHQQVIWLSPARSVAYRADAPQPEAARSVIERWHHPAAGLFASDRRRPFVGSAAKFFQHRSTRDVPGRPGVRSACRRIRCTASATLVYWLWWVAGAVLLIVAVTQLRRTPRPILDLAPLVLGVVMAAQYLFTVPYAAPRFAPAYPRWPAPRCRRDRPDKPGTHAQAPPVLGTVLTAFVAHTAVQLHVVTARIRPRAGRRRDR